jgi:hypothetical protein
LPPLLAHGQWHPPSPLPEFLKGRPLVREWQEPDGKLHISVEIHNTLLGHIFGYEGIYSRV